MEELTADANKYSQQLIDLVVTWGPKLVTAILTLIIGLWVIGMIVRGLGKAMDKRNVDASLAPFLKSLIGAILKTVSYTHLTLPTTPYV